MEAQKLRVVWLVQMLTDQCDMRGFVPSDAAKEPAEDYQVQYETEVRAHCLANRTADDERIVHTYPESWYLTGLAARKDLGLDVAVIWEDPAQDDRTDVDDWLWHAARGLLVAFVGGPDNDGNGRRDLGVSPRNGADGTIADRLDDQGSVPDGDAKRWGIPIQRLDVATFERSDQDFIGQVASQEVRAILEDNFAGAYQAVKPTLLVAREETSISLDLSAAQSITSDEAGATVELSFEGQSSETLAAVSWAPYRYNSDIGPDGNVIGWETYPFSEHWDDMEVELIDAFSDLDPELNPYRDSESAVIGEMLVARSLYVALNRGITSYVQYGSLNAGAQERDLVLACELSGSCEDEYDTELMDNVAGSLGAVNSAYWVIVPFILAFIENWNATFKMTSHLSGAVVEIPTAFTTLEKLGDGFKDVGKGWMALFNIPDLVMQIKSLSSMKWKVALGGAAFALFAVGAAAITACIVAAALSKDAVKIIAYVARSMEMATYLVGAIKAIYEAVQMLKGLKEIKSLLSNMASASGIGNAIGYGIGVVITWAMFAWQAVALDPSWQEMGYMVAKAIASTIVLVLMQVISQIPIVGTIIEAFILMLDCFISILCSLVGWDKEAEGDNDPYNDAGDWLCGGLEGIVQTLLTWFIFAGNDMVDFEDENRLNFYELNANRLRNPDDGMIPGNALLVSVALTNTITMNPLPKNLGATGWEEWSDENLHTSTFAYAMEIEEQDLHDDLERGSLYGEWQYADGTPPGEMWGAYHQHKPEPLAITRSVPAIEVELPGAGINRPLTAGLAEGYAVPVQNCYASVVCLVETERETLHFSLSENLIYDIFPATLDGFYDLVPIAFGAYALSWGQDGDVRFPRLRDADGDGLPYTSDPNDNAWDADGDGVSDAYELEIGSDPELTDSDQDHLSDYDELRLGTSPTRKDTDGDGLWDGEEVLHQDRDDVDGDGDRIEWTGGWRFVYRVSEDGLQESMWVASDPQKLDADGDGLTDAQEKLYGFNPNVWSTDKVLDFSTAIMEGAGDDPTDGYVRPSDTLHYTATVKNELLDKYMQGLLTPLFSAAADPAGLEAQPFVLQPTQSRSLGGYTTVAGAATGVYSFTQSAGALVTDWKVLSQGVKLWLPMEDPTTQDRSGSFPPNDATCTGACPSVTGGRYGNALSLDGSSYLTSPADPNEAEYAVSLWYKTSTANGNGALYAVDADNGVKIYLENGMPCAKLGTASPICGTSSTADDEWHHLVHTYGGEAGGQKLYIDGAQVASSTASTTAANNGDVFIGHADGKTNLTGLIDDVRLYDTGLTAAQVRALLARPVLDMKFENPTQITTGYRYGDDSTFENAGTCPSGSCPSGTTGILGSGVAFVGANKYITMDSDASLDLSEGHFTVAAWIKPDTMAMDADHCADWFVEGGTGTCVARQPEAILGWHNGSAAGYATLQRQVVALEEPPYEASRLRFGFGTADAWSGYYESPLGVIQDNAWNHVVLTFGDGVVTLYVNGELKDSDEVTFPAGTKPAATQYFEIGARTTAAPCS